MLCVRVQQQNHQNHQNQIHQNQNHQNHLLQLHIKRFIFSSSRSEPDRRRSGQQLFQSVWIVMESAAAPPDLQRHRVDAERRCTLDAVSIATFQTFLSCLHRNGGGTTMLWSLHVVGFYQELRNEADPQKHSILFSSTHRLNHISDQKTMKIRISSTNLQGSYITLLYFKTKH